MSPASTNATTTEGSTKALKAMAPFDDPTADLILRTSDNVDFHVHTVIMSFASSVFQDMFSMANSGMSDSSDMPIVPLSELSPVLDVVLRACHPGAAPARVDTLAALQNALDVARKYNMGRAEATLCLMLAETRFCEGNAVLVYAMACRYKAVTAARAATYHTLGLSYLDGDDHPAMEYATAGDLRRLARYHRQCGQVAENAIKGFSRTALQSRPGSSWIWFTHSAPPSSNPGMPSRQPAVSGFGSFGSMVECSWWSKLLQELSGIIRRNPRHGASFREITKTNAYNEAEKCAACVPRLIRDLLEFETLLSAQVSAAVSKVRTSE